MIHTHKYSIYYRPWRGRARSSPPLPERSSGATCPGERSPTRPVDLPRPRAAVAAPRSVRAPPERERGEGGPACRRREEGGGRRRPVARAGVGEGHLAQRGSEERGAPMGREAAPAPPPPRTHAARGPPPRADSAGEEAEAGTPPQRLNLRVSTSAAATGEDWPPGAGAGWWRGPAPATAEPRSGRRSHARRRAGPTSLLPRTATCAARSRRRHLRRHAAGGEDNSRPAEILHAAVGPLLRLPGVSDPASHKASPLRSGRRARREEGGAVVPIHLP